MSDSTVKKVRVYNLAREINISDDSLLTFLKKQGFSVQTHMSLLSDEMITRVNNHFRKDIEKNEKHQKKMAQIKQKKAEEQKEKQAAEEFSKSQMSADVYEDNSTPAPENFYVERSVPEPVAPAPVVTEVKPEPVEIKKEEAPKVVAPVTPAPVQESATAEKPVVAAQEPEPVKVVPPKVEQPKQEQRPAQSNQRNYEQRDREPRQDYRSNNNQGGQNAAPTNFRPATNPDGTRKWERTERTNNYRNDRPNNNQGGQQNSSNNQRNDRPGYNNQNREPYQNRGEGNYPNRDNQNRGERPNYNSNYQNRDGNQQRPYNNYNNNNSNSSNYQGNRQGGYQQNNNQGYTPNSQQPSGQRYKTRTEQEMATGKKGLTILGKIDLDKKPRQEFDNRNRQDRPPRPDQRPISGGPAVPPRGVAVDPAEALKNKNKNKSKNKSKKKTTEEEEAKAKKPAKKFEIDQKDVRDSIRRTLLAMEDSGVGNRAKLRNKKRKERQEEEERRQEVIASNSNKITVTEFISVGELANMVGVSADQIIAKGFELGLMVTINQRLNGETIQLIALEFGFEVDFAKEYTSDALEDTPDDEETLTSRMPIVTIMGHVDHGKTSLLDYIRKANVVAGESGGITQHIGAYKVHLDKNSDKFITFLDTPGHEAFTAMRARGAQVTDIVVLVVAADDSVMPQTIEAINHAQAAGVPIIVAINKIDKPAANPDRIRQQLADRNVLVEEYGGKYQCVEISAKQGLNVQLLLEKILLEAELLELKANSDRTARGVVIESKLETGRGVTSTVLIQKGTLSVGDPFIAGIYQGRVKAMFDERDRKVQSVGPSTPIQILGFDGTPQAGDLFIVVDSDRTAREIALKRQALKREQDNKQVKHLTLDEISRQISMGGVKELPIVVKADVDGSVEALSDSLMRLSTGEVNVNVIHRGVGAISESDVLLANASNAIIVGFHVRPHLNARKLAETQKVDIRIYHVIYDAINEVKAALEGLLEPVISEEVTASIEVRDTFKVPKVGTVAGCFVQEGKVIRGNKIRIVRDGIVLTESEIDTLKRFKDDVKEVDTGYECGISLKNFNDLKAGDILECYKLVETKKKLS